jgi:hypothetical protein
MTMFSVGKATIVRIEETYQPVYNPKELFPEFTDEVFNEHKHWLAPDHYDPASNKVKLSVHSWLLKLGISPGRRARGGTCSIRLISNGSRRPARGLTRSIW